MISKIEEQLKNQILTDPFCGNAVAFVLGKIGDIRDKVILDSGCGCGEMSVFFALQGAKVIGIDKNKLAIDSSKKFAQSNKVEEKCLFVQGCSELMPVDSASIDIIFSRSTIQYMDHRKVLNEYLRILKPLGIIILIENLPYNPIINIYRLFRRIFARTPQDIKYLNSIRGYITLNDIKKFADYFRYTECREYHFVRVISIPLRLLLKHNHFVEKIDLLLSKIDNRLFNGFSFLRRFAWFTALYCKEKK